MIKLRPLTYILSAAALTAPHIAFAQLQRLKPFDGTAQGGLINAVINVINAMLVLAAIAAVVFIIIAGVRMYSALDQDSVAEAKHSLYWGILGIIVILLSAAIVNFFLVAVR